MAKIDFDSDSAPFTGSVLPTIEDVAMLSADDGKYEVAHEKRSSEQKSDKVQLFLLPFVIFMGGVVLAFFYVVGLSSPQPVSQGGFGKIPVEQARDIRVIDNNPREESLVFALKLARQGRKVVFFHSAKNPPKQSKEDLAGIDFYPVPDGSLGGNGVLLDGYKWFPLSP